MSRTTATRRPIQRSGQPRSTRLAVPRWHRVLALALGLVVMGVTGLVIAGPAPAALDPTAARTAAWLAAQVGPDGSVSVPGETFSAVTQTMYVAQGLAVTDAHRVELERAMGYISLHVDEWVTNDGSGSTVAPSGSDLPERLGSLILLVHATGGNPRAFGVPAQDLVARVQALYSIDSPGFYGYQEPYSAVQDQSMVVLALTAVGSPPPTAAVQWLVGMQCTGGGDAPSAIGGWVAYRPTTGGVPDPCTAPDPLNYTGADTNSTAFAVQALVTAGETAPVAAAMAFLAAAQAPGAGFPWFTGGDPDANSTALVVQAIVASGGAPTGPAWSAAGATPLDALAGWQLGPPDDGALEATWSPGVPSLLATYQGLWGLTATPLPFPVLPDPTPSPDRPVIPVHAG